MTNQIYAEMSAAAAARGNKQTPLIEMRDIYKIFKTGAGDFTALNGVNVCFFEGEFVSVVGKSGSGKSTLVNILTGIDHPTSGSVRVGEHTIHQLSEGQMSTWRGTNLGIIFQFFQLLPMLSILENIMLPMDFAKRIPFQEREDRAMHLLELVGLQDYAHDLPAEVSGGQQQSAAIARSLANDPPLIIADEPTGNLDSRSAETVLNLFEELATSGKTIMIVTHDPSITQRTDQTVILSDGEIIDQTVARALPLLTHPQMMAATRQAIRQEYSPLTTIIRQGDSVDHFSMIVEGEVEIVVRGDDCGEMSLACLGPGQFFGEVELTHGDHSIASVRASKSGAKVAVLPRNEFFKLIDGSPLTRDAIRGVAETRIAENKRRRKTDC